MKREKMQDREGFTVEKAKVKPKEVRTPNYQRYAGLVFCKPHGINIDHCNTCKATTQAKADSVAAAKAKKLEQKALKRTKTSAAVSPQADQ